MLNISENNNIDWLVFIFALIGAPLLVTLLTFWAFVPVFALILGGPFYLLLAPPFLIWMLRRHGPNYILAILGACVSLIAVPPIMAAYGLLTGTPRAFEDGLAFALMGLIFAPAYAAAFVFIYKNAPLALGPKE